MTTDGGQETIALYEERLSAADTKRYELEDLVVSLEEQLRASARPPSPGAAARQASSAAEIENEMLRDQVQHLQKNIRTLEDTLERMCTANKHEDATMRERIKRYKEREDATRKNLAEGYQEVERVRKEMERVRVEEAKKLAQSMKEKGTLKVDIDVSLVGLVGLSLRFDAFACRTSRISTPTISCSFK